MPPKSDTTSAAQAAQQSSASSNPPQRQSCDRCHRQKLRCTRTKSNNGDVCDRCLAKRAECVHSTSLPKGRPSLRRQAVGDLNSGNTAVTDVSVSTQEATPSVSKEHPIFTDTVAPTMVPEPMDLSMYAWPWLGTTSWEEMQPDMRWEGMRWEGPNFNRADLDALFLNTNNLDGAGSGPEDFDPFSPTQLSSTSNQAKPPSYNFGQPGIGNYERPVDSTRSSLESSFSGSTMSVCSENSASIWVEQLSQLSVHLSSLRSLSQNLAQSADSPAGRRPSDGHVPLIDSAALESVTTWLAREESLAYMTMTTFQDLESQPNSQNGPNILRDVLSASYRLMEILRHLHADYITRHLVIACEALLLEVYAAILTVFQHEAYPGDSMNTTPLGNVRLVMAVQLCAYLIERQHQAVGKYLAPVAAQKPSVPNPLPCGLQFGTTDRECLIKLKAQVDQKLTRLQQMLRCN